MNAKNVSRQLSSIASCLYFVSETDAWIKARATIECVDPALQPTPAIPARTRQRLRPRIPIAN